MNKQELKFSAQREKLVSLLQDKGIADKNVLRAIARVPRHKFMEPSLIEFSYEDKAYPIYAGQTISQPYTVAFQTELLAVKKGDNILEIGTGSGYQAAVLSELQAAVYSIERQKKLFDITYERLYNLGYKIKCFLGDGFKGLPNHAPFDKIIITAGAREIPKELLKQLKINGWMVIPYGDDKKQEMLKITRISEVDFQTEKFGTFAFVPMLHGINQ